MWQRLIRQFFQSGQADCPWVVCGIAIYPLTLMLLHRMSCSVILSIENLRVDYGDLTAVDDVGLEVEAGQIFGLVGPNGAGKTSCIRVVATLLEPTHGRVLVNGYDVLETPAEARQHIGYMPDLAPVNPDLRVEEFLELYDRSYGLPASGRNQRVEEAIHSVGLSGKKGTLAKHLSRGLTQRLVLAKTLLHQPSLLLLDEPASGMDPIARRELRSILRAQAEAGRAVLISSHILSELADMCTHVAMMCEGRLQVAGAVDKITRLKGRSVRVILVEVTDTPAHLAAWLEDYDGVSSVVATEHGARFQFQGDDAATAGLLTALTARGFPVIRFEPERNSLEDVLTSLSGHNPKGGEG